MHISNVRYFDPSGKSIVIAEMLMDDNDNILATDSSVDDIG